MADDVPDVDGWLFDREAEGPDPKLPYMVWVTVRETIGSALHHAARNLMEDTAVFEDRGGLHINDDAIAEGVSKVARLGMAYDEINRATAHHHAEHMKQHKLDPPDEGAEQ